MYRAVERRTICKEYFSNGECHFANKGWIVYVLTVLSSSVYPAGSTSSAYWMRSPLFIHSFPRGQVLSFWWMGLGTGQLFSLDRTSLTCSELKRPPCQRSSAIPVLFRSPRSRSHLLTLTQTPAHNLTSLGQELGLFVSVSLYIFTALNASCLLDVMESAPAFKVGGEDVTMLDVWGWCSEAFEHVAVVLVDLLTAARKPVSQLKLV